MATLAIVCLLAFLTAAGISAERTASQSVTCMANLRTLTRAWQQFAMDKQYLPPNPDDGNTTPGFNWVPGVAGRSEAHEFNSDMLADPTRSLLFPYLTEKDTSIFRCPDDMRQGLYYGQNPQKVGTRVFAARSYSMNVAVGTTPYAKAARTPTEGAWLDNNHRHNYDGNGLWRTYGRFDDIVDPSPASLFVFIDENASSINDGTFAFGMEKEEWIDWPGTRHETGAVVSFADGHTVLRRWVDPRTVRQNHTNSVGRLLVPGNVDYQWLRERISAPKLLNRTLVVPRPESMGPPAVKLVWPAQDGVNYRVEFSDDLVEWRSLGASAQVSGQEASATDTSPNTLVGRFYRFISGGF